MPHVLNCRWCLDLLDSFDLVGLGFDPMMGHKEPKQLSGGNTKYTLLRVELQIDLAQISKCLLQILNKGGSILGLDHNIIHVGLYVSVQLRLKTNLDCPCKSGPGTLQSEWHADKTVRTTWSDERHLLFIFLGHEDLMIPRICVQKGEKITT